MQTLKNFILILLISSSIVGCGDRMEPIEYFNYFNNFNEGSFIEHSENGFIYQLQLRSPEFMAINELKGTDAQDFSDVSSISKDFEEGQNFCLRIKSEKHEDVMRKNLTSEEGYYKRIEMLSTYFPLMVTGMSGTDSIPCQFHHFERTYTVRPFVQVLFTLKENQDLEKIIFTDAIFNSGNSIELDHIKTYIEELPKLKL